MAVIGASSIGTAQGNNFIRALCSAGYDGRIVPIHPSAPSIEGLPTASSLATLAEPVDYAYFAIPALLITPLLRQASGKTRFVQIMSSGFGDAAARRELLDAVHAGGMRLLGPNCMALYSPAGRIGLVNDGVGEPGPAGIVSQSGGLSIDLLRSGWHRGLRFSALLSIGNSLDLGPSDFLAHFLADDATRVIGIYLEDLQHGRHFFELLRRARAAKPVVLLRGGRTARGQRAAASRPASLAGDDRIWRAPAAQTGSVLVDTLPEFINALALFQSEPPQLPRSCRRTMLLGNGGGTSVLAADMLSHQGVELAALDEATLQTLARLDIADGASLGNPVDIPANILQRDDGAPRAPDPRRADAGNAGPARKPAAAPGHRAGVALEWRSRVRSAARGRGTAGDGGRHRGVQRPARRRAGAGRAAAPRRFPLAPWLDRRRRRRSRAVNRFRPSARFQAQARASMPALWPAARRRRAPPARRAVRRRRAARTPACPISAPAPFPTACPC